MTTYENDTLEEMQEASAKRKEQLVAYRKETGLVETTTAPGVAGAEERAVPFEDGEKASEASQSGVQDDQFFEEVIEAEEDETVEAPKESAKKDEWVAYRVQTHELSEEEAEEKTKQELIDLA